MDIFYVNGFPMRGKMVLLVADEGVDMAIVFREFEDSFAEWFSEIKPWSREMVAKIEIYLA